MENAMKRILFLFTVFFISSSFESGPVKPLIPEPLGPTHPVIVDPNPKPVAPADGSVVFVNPVTGEVFGGSIFVVHYQYLQIQFDSARYISQIWIENMTTGSKYSYDFNCFVETVDVFHPIDAGRWRISVVTRLMGMTEVIETEVLINRDSTGCVIPIN